jgi:hypothetical protein
VQYARIKIFVSVLSEREIGLSAIYAGNNYVTKTRKGIVSLKARIFFAGMDPVKDR